MKKQLARYGEDYVAHEPIIFDHSSVAHIDYFALHQHEDIIELILQGKILYLRDIRRLLLERGFEIDDLEMILHLLTLKGQVARVPSVRYAEIGATACNRVGSNTGWLRYFARRAKKNATTARNV